MVRDLFPQAWQWMWEKDVFWTVQGVVVSSVIIFWIGPRWAKMILFPVLVVIMGMYVLGEMETTPTSTKTDRKEEEKTIPKPPSEAQIRGFLSNPSPPGDLLAKKERGEIWDLEILYAGVVIRGEWTRVIELPVPPRRRHYRIEVEILSGSVDVMNRGKYVGRHPEEKLPLSRRALRLQFRSARLPQTAIVIWRWTQGSY
ncbi:MAG: hypothetical protein ACQESA_03765 [Patescibacteria group bacterium]